MENITAVLTKLDGGIETYTTVSDAAEPFNDLTENGGTLELYSDLTYSGTFGSQNAPKEMAIDLNEYYVTPSQGDPEVRVQGGKLTIQDSSTYKNGGFASTLTISGTASLIVDGVEVGKITAADANAKITLHRGTRFNDYRLPEGMILAYWIEDGYCVKNGNSNAELDDGTPTAGGPGNYRVEEVPAAITASSTSGEIRYDDRVSVDLLPEIDPYDSPAPDSYMVTWYYKKDNKRFQLGMGTLRGTSFAYNQSYVDFSGTTIGDTLDVFCIIRAEDREEDTLWQTVITGYTLTGTRGQAEVTKAPAAIETAAHRR